MSTAVAVRPAAEIEPSLSELAEVAKSEHALTMQSGRSMLMHAIKAGEALLQAKARVEQGGWYKWLRDNFPATDKTAHTYMRVARSKDAVLSSGVRTVEEAEQVAPPIKPEQIERILQRPDLKAEQSEARQMAKEGATFRAIGDRFGIHEQTAKAWVEPGFRERRNRRLREQRRLARQARERKAAKKATGAMSELYASCERMQDLFGAARDEATTNEARSSLAAAEQLYREMRDSVVRAMGAGK